ncbi:response regulator [Microbacterium oleivorans]|uniref:Response regulator transcription factor n=1 Tax=Microbacterium oleivorans TaxID=273677 RepID=A0A4R5YPJ8_9MICO|nr:response regulator transcription factor [Microbacterium oleivorans]TDL45267.1 response regulator transcription factor [Microbacterium oleivorans]
MTAVVLVDDQAMIRAGLRGILQDAGIDVIGEAPDGEAGLTLIRKIRPDVVLMDLRMPVLDGVETVRQLRADSSFASVRVLVLTTFDGDQDVVAALSAGADGFLSKTADPEDLVAAVSTVGTGEATLSAGATRAVIRHLMAAPTTDMDPLLAGRVVKLTDRERGIVAAAARGHDNAQIAADLSISPFTVKTHLNRAMAKLDARDRGQLVALAYQAGIARS